MITEDMIDRTREVMLEEDTSGQQSRYTDAAILSWLNIAKNILVNIVVEAKPSYFVVYSEVTYPADAIYFDLAGMGDPPMPGEAFRIVGIDDVTNAGSELPVLFGELLEREDTKRKRVIQVGATAIKIANAGSTAYTLRVWWMSLPPDMAVDEDSPPFAPHLHWVMVYLAAALMMEHTEDITDELQARLLFGMQAFLNYHGITQSQEPMRFIPRQRG